MSKSHSFPVRVYYEDTDFSGVVYHASYLRFLERGRTELLRTLDIHQGAISVKDPASRFGFAVRAMTIEFLKPARMDDLLTIETRKISVNGASLELQQKILRGEELLVSAEVRIACVSDGRPARLPADIRDKLTGWS
ncbi:MAG: tol-pal system-associated acyl-CoA thioesterase [Beijerinckiaceae bacterium]|nr:tol-pal system-associated acyl-CoA thioesterase [Beijerinckiaceae bacterium]